MKKLLLTNDDGIEAEGLKILIDALQEQYSITVVAPNVERSGSSLSISPLKSIEVKKVDRGKNIVAYSVAGTPADCIKLALSAGFCERPDLIVSGINPGSNAGRNLFYSGTVGAVIEGSFKNVSGVAFSMHYLPKTPPKLKLAAPIMQEIIAHLLDHPLPIGTLLNVNFPIDAPYKGMKWTKQGIGVWRELPTTTCDIASGSAKFHLGMDHFLPEEEESDTYWLEKGFVTLVPLRAELTDHQLLAERRGVAF